MELISKFSVVRLMAVLAIIIVLADTKQLTKPASSYFNICPRGDSKALEECVKKNMIDLKPQLRTGIPAIGVIPLEPLVLPKIVFNEGGTFVLNTTMTNVIFRGVTDFSVNSVTMKLNEDRLVANISLKMPDVKVVGDYDMAGKLLLLPLKGQGNFQINTTNLVSEINFVSKSVSRNGKRYLEVVDVGCNFILNGASTTRFNNLFNGDKTLGDATNAFLNENYKETHEAVKHLPEGAFAELFKDIVSKIFTVYSIDELFTN